MRYAVATLMSLQLLLVACAGQTPQDTLGAASALPGVETAQAIVSSPYEEERHSTSGDARRRFAQANALIEARDWQSAVSELQALTQSYPQLSGPCLNLALVYQQLGDEAQAQLWFQKGIESNANNINLYNAYGVFLREQGQFDEAEKIYLQALAVWEASADTHRNLGILYDLYKGEPDKALQHYDRYQALTGSENRAVAGWIADLERQYPALVLAGDS
jgi:Tfp pilus assembly protein PilF